jgi:thioredoxin-related protein
MRDQTTRLWLPHFRTGAVRNAFLLAVMLAIHGWLPQWALADQPNWIRDLETGKREAKASGKNLLIVFTGHGHCVYCDILDREVFQKGWFLSATKEKYVFVELDYNFGDTPQEKLRQQQLDKLQTKYLIHGIPTVVLADPAGVPFYIATGYTPKAGPLELLIPMAVAEKAVRARDHYFNLAKSTGGEERVQNLHKGLQVVAPFLGSMSERQNDPVLVFYKDPIDEIVSADSSSTGSIRAHYVAQRKKRDDWLAKESVFAKLKEFESKRDNRGAIAYVDEALENKPDGALRWRLERARQVYLEWDSQYAVALENAQRLLKLPGLDSDQLNFLLDREVFNLFNLGRIDEGLAHYDRRISQAGPDQEKRRNLMSWKAQMIRSRNRPEQSVQIWREYRSVTKPGSEEWQEATAMLVGELQRAGQHRAAINLAAEFPKGDLPTVTMLDVAVSHLKLDEIREAREQIGEVGKTIQKFKTSDRNADREFAKRIEARLNKIRAQLGETKP